MENNFKTPGWLPSKEALLQVIIMQISHYFSYAHTTIFLQHQYYCGWWNIFWNTHFYTHSPAEPRTISWIFIISMQRVSEWEWHKYHYQPRDEIKWLNCDSENHVQVKHHSFEHLSLSVDSEPWFIEDDKDANDVQSVVVDNPGDDIKCSVPVVIL